MDNHNDQILTLLYQLIPGILVLLIEYLVLLPLRERARRKTTRKTGVSPKATIPFTQRVRSFIERHKWTFYYWILFSAVISIFVIAELNYANFVEWLSHTRFERLATLLPQFISLNDRSFNIDFVDWFGVLFGIITPITLVRLWEQFDEIDMEFDREIDALTIFFEDILFLTKKYDEFQRSLLHSVQIYVNHVYQHIQKEYKDTATQQQGQDYLRNIRNISQEFAQSLNPSEGNDGTVTKEFIRGIYEISDIRADRIALSQRHSFRGFRILIIFASLLWILPFYFLPQGADGTTGIFSNILRVAVTTVVILMLTIIEDLNDPFSGKWQINLTAWERLNEKISTTLVDLKKNQPNGKNQQAIKSVAKRNRQRATEINNSLKVKPKKKRAAKSA